MTDAHPTEADYERAAKEEGWRWSDAHGGYINDDFREGDSSDYGSYIVFETAVEACSYADIEVKASERD